VLELLLADARLPGGGHTQSAGLEAALLAGMPIRAVPDYLRTRLATVVMVEAGTAVVARAVCSVDPVRAVRLADVDRAWRARVLSPALRSASLQLGRGYARLVARVWPGPWADALTDALPVGRAVAVGVAAHQAGLDAAATARLVAYDDVQTVCSAALKLHPMDPADATVWAVRVADEVEALAGRLAILTSPEDIPALGAVHMEAWAERHAVSPQRLFRA
jgi:urease accessory protein